MTDFPKMLYRDGTEFEWDGRPTDTLVVTDNAEFEAAIDDGWLIPRDYLGSTKAEVSLLDKTAKDIEAELPNLDLDALEKLKADETDGKTRKGVLAAIEAAIDAKLKG